VGRIILLGEPDPARGPRVADPWSIAVVRKVVDIDPKGSIGPSKGSINSHGVEWVSLNGT